MSYGNFPVSSKKLFRKIVYVIGLVMFANTMNTENTLAKLIPADLIMFLFLHGVEK